MAVTVRQKSEVVGTGTSPVVTEPAGAASGDVLFAFALVGNSSALTAPSGWTQLFHSAVGAVTWDVSYIARGGSAPSLTWTITGSIYREVYVVCLQKTGAALVLDAQSAAGASNASSAALPNPPAVIAIATSSLALCVGLNFGVSGAVWACAGYTVQTTNGSGFDGAVFSKTLSAAGSEDPAQWTGPGAAPSQLWDGATVTFTDVAADVLLVAPGPHQAFRNSPGLVDSGGFGRYF